MGMLGHAFFSGLGIALSFTAVNVLLLEEHGSEQLPVIYGFSAILLLLGGFIYSKLEHKVAPVKLFPALLFFSAAWAFAARGLTQGGESPILLAAVYCSYFLIYQINNLEFWGAAALLYDVRQSKRLFGLLAAGESIAKIIGYAITPVFIAAFSLDDLMILAGISFLISALILYRITRREQESFRIEHSHTKHHEPRQTKILGAFQFLRNLRSDSFMRNVALFALCSTLVYYAIHYAFLIEVEEQFHQLEDLAFFFGLFFSIAKALNLIIKSLLSGRMLNSVGIRLLIIMLPLTLTLINLIGVSGFFILNDPVKFFLWIFGFNMLADEIMRSSLHKPSYLTLFQPLQKNRRLEGHTIAKGIMEPLGMGIAGITILTLVSLNLFVPSTFIMYILLFVVAWLITSLIVSKEYRNLLGRALKSRLLNRQNISFSKEELTLLKNEKLNSSDDVERLYALKMLKDHLNEEELEHIVDGLLISNDPLVLLETLTVIENSGMLQHRERLKDLLFHPNKEIGKKAIYCYCATLEEDCVDELMPYFETVNDEWKEGILGGILKYSGIYGATVAGDALLQWIHSEDAGHRKRVARLIGEIGKEDYYHPLLRLLHDPDQEVRKEAIVAAGKVNNRKLIEPILECAGEKHLFNTCLRTLEKMGEEVIPGLEKMVSKSENLRVIRKMIRIASKIPGNSTHLFLLKMLGHPSFTLRNEALYSLHVLQYKALSQTEKDLIEAQLKNEIQAYKVLIGYVVGDDTDPGLPVHTSVRNELHMIQFRALYLLGFIYDQAIISKVIDSLKTGGHHYQSNACELLENLLKRRHAQKIVPMIEFDTRNPNPEKNEFRQLEASLFENIWNLPPGIISDWLAALSLRWQRVNFTRLKVQFSDDLSAQTHSLALQQELKLYKSHSIWN